MRRGALAFGILLLLPAAANAADFEKAVVPALVKHCVACHNPVEARGGLDLTRPEGLLKGGKSGAAVVAGRDDESYLIERVAAGSMPPKKGGTRLSEREVAALRDWVRGGAPWPAGRVLSPFEFTTDRRAGYDWWAFQPVGSPSPPTPLAGTARETWVRNPIDRFVLRRLEQSGLEPAPPADRATYLRRVHFDLLGLPPT